MQFPEQLAIGRTLLVFAYLAMLGLLQIIGARYHRRDLASLSQSRGASAVLGGAMIIVAYAWFFGTQQDGYLSPGPASFEFGVIMLAGLGTALATTRLFARLRGNEPAPLE